MAHSKANGDENKGSFFEISLFIVAAFGSILMLVWLVASNKIVWASLKPMLTLGAMWKIIPSDYFYEQWNSVVVSTTNFSRDPTSVSFFDWIGYVNTAAMPLTFLVSLSYIGLLVLLFLRRKINIFRVFEPGELLEHTTKIFSGVAPVIKIRAKIINNELPQWRIQVTPEEAFLGRHNGRPLVQSGELDVTVATGYFQGVKSGISADGRIASAMLGRQVVDLVSDSKKASAICFPDRMSNEGKALYALWAAVAFGGQGGKTEYAEYSRKLNMSAYGSKTGMANLTVVQPLYNKYRTNREAMNLFAIHHWEHTVLFALLEIAQRRGRYTTAEVLWLRPTNRVMFFSLNSCGSKTPHVEAAATFNQILYERACHAQKRLPLFRDEEGKLKHFIYVRQAVQGLKEEHEHWKASTDENDEWWKQPDLWTRRDAAMSAILNEYAVKSAAAVPVAPVSADSPFDVQARAQQAEADAREARAMNAAAGGGAVDPF